MIFLTVGSEISFDRLTKAVDQWCYKNKQIQLFGQIADPGPNGYYPQHCKWEKFISPSKYNKMYDEAELIISHAGMGSIITALITATPIIILPRHSILHETRNDHQIATAKRFSNHNGVFTVDTEAMLDPMIDQIVKNKTEITMKNVGSSADKQLIDTIRQFIRNS